MSLLYKLIRKLIRNIFKVILLLGITYAFYEILSHCLDFSLWLVWFISGLIVVIICFLINIYPCSIKEDW